MNFSDMEFGKVKVDRENTGVKDMDTFMEECPFQDDWECLELQLKRIRNTHKDMCLG